MESLIAAVREQEEAARFLAWPGDFDLDRGDHVEEVHLASGAAAALGLGLPDQAEVLARLREVATRWGEDFVLILTPEGHPYEPLFAP
ncbi:hypothetical protein [Streptomyces anulatus]|uniref:hypothetical protein n=1 Tax=Streptomyces anulatus TaxID=1892 RepID=UPI0013B83B1C|nr:hypothetical protein [Streptomyces anulatus]NDZ60450.1 hypothetical protein [Streptomyces anulatus]